MEGRRQPNVMIKVPATPEGIPAIKQLISEGININVTLLFAVEAYEKVAHAYIEGLAELAKKGGNVSGVASVASFFVSRIDALVDGQLEKKGSSEAKALLGKTAIANAKLAYIVYQTICATPEWKALAAKGAMPQRLLWASTGTKNPAYADTLYVDELVGPETVNTIPPATFKAFADHGKLRASLTENLEGAQGVLNAIKAVGIDFKSVTDMLLEDGVQQFATAFGKLLKAVDVAQK